MIGFLEGEILAKSPGLALVKVGGVGYQVSVSLSGNYLGLWYNMSSRMMVWDIEDTEKPRPIGTVRLPYDTRPLLQLGQSSMEPFQRDDGAIGFVLKSHGPVWMELPGLRRG